MPVQVHSYAKINLGLAIGERLDTGFHQLRTIYQTIRLHDALQVSVGSGAGVEILCCHPNVPRDHTNTCWRVAERFLQAAHAQGRVTIQIDKHLPVQGGLGAASSNAVATLLALERELKTTLSPEDRLAIAADVGSDLPLFLIGGTVLGIGRGEQVYPLPDLPPLPLVVATPAIGVSTAKAFADWDSLLESQPAALTRNAPAARMEMFSRTAFRWLTGSLSGVPAPGGRDRGEKDALLLDLVRAGIENDFERVVFSQYPELHEAKRVLEREGARYASLSGSGSALFGIFGSQDAADLAAARMQQSGIAAVATSTLPRADYWREMSRRFAGV